MYVLFLRDEDEDCECSFTSFYFSLEKLQFWAFLAHEKLNYSKFLSRFGEFDFLFPNKWTKILMLSQHDIVTDYCFLDLMSIGKSHSLSYTLEGDPKALSCVSI